MQFILNLLWWISILCFKTNHGHLLPYTSDFTPYCHHSQKTSWIRPWCWDPYGWKQATAITTSVTWFIHSLLFILATVHERMLHCDFFEDFPDSQLFPSVHDAVLYAQLSTKSKEWCTSSLLLNRIQIFKQILSTYLCSVKIMGTYGSVPFYVLLCFILEADFCDNSLTA